MSEAHIHYHVPEVARRFGDTEMIINAIGAFQDEKSFPIDRQYEQEPSEDADGTVFIKFKRIIPEQKYNHELLEETERMRRGVERHFSDEERARLSQHFAGIAIIDGIETE